MYSLKEGYGPHTSSSLHGTQSGAGHLEILEGLLEKSWSKGLAFQMPDLRLSTNIVVDCSTEKGT